MKQTSRSVTKGSLAAAEIMALQEHRLEADLTYRELAVRVGIALSKLHELLNNPTVTANDRTAFKVRRYLTSIPRKARATA
jgi:hypothetical protein